jgi:hypothetical protein
MEHRRSSDINNFLEYRILNLFIKIKCILSNLIKSQKAYFLFYTIETLPDGTELGYCVWFFIQINLDLVFRKANKKWLPLGAECLIVKWQSWIVL